MHARRLAVLVREQGAGLMQFLLDILKGLVIAALCAIGAVALGWWLL